MRVRPGFRKDLNFINRSKKREIAQFQLTRISTAIKQPEVTSLVGPAVVEHIEEFQDILGANVKLQMVENSPKVFSKIVDNYNKIPNTYNLDNVNLQFADILDMKPTNFIDFDATKSLPTLEKSVRHLIKNQKDLAGTKALIVAVSQRHRGLTKQGTVDLFLQIVKEELGDTCEITPFKARTSGNMATLKTSTNKVEVLDMISYRDGGCPMMTITLIYK